MERGLLICPVIGRGEANVVADGCYLGDNRNVVTRDRYIVKILIKS